MLLGLGFYGLSYLIKWSVRHSQEDLDRINNTPWHTAASLKKSFQDSADEHIAAKMQVKLLENQPHLVQPNTLNVHNSNAKSVLYEAVVHRKGLAEGKIVNQFVSAYRLGVIPFLVSDKTGETIRIEEWPSNFHQLPLKFGAQTLLSSYDYPESRYRNNSVVDEVSHKVIVNCRTGGVSGEAIHYEAKEYFLPCTKNWKLVLIFLVGTSLFVLGNITMKDGALAMTKTFTLSEHTEQQVIDSLKSNIFAGEIVNKMLLGIAILCGVSAVYSFFKAATSTNKKK